MQAGLAAREHWLQCPWDSGFSAEFEAASSVIFRVQDTTPQNGIENHEKFVMWPRSGACRAAERVSRCYGLGYTPQHVVTFKLLQSGESCTKAQARSLPGLMLAIYFGVYELHWGVR